MVSNLTEGNPTKKIMSLVFSMLAASLMSYIYNITDSIMVGKFVSPDALGAISASSPLNILLANISAMTISGFCIIAGQVFGMGDERQLRKLSANILYTSGMVIVFITVVSVMVLRPCLELMGTPPAFLEMANEYMMIIVFARIFSLFSGLCSGMMRALGDSKTTLYVSLATGFANVCFNYLFLSVIPLGIAGAAWGTFCSCALGMMIYLYLMVKKMKLLHFGREEAPMNFHLVGKLLARGIPLGLQSSVVSVGAIILQSAVNSHGETVVTGIAVGSKLLTLFWMIFESIETALLYFCAQNLGAGRSDRIRQGTRNVLVIQLGIGLACFLIAVFGGKYVHMCFVGRDEELLSVAGNYLFSQIVFFPFMVTLSTWRGAVKGCGASVPSLCCGVIELVVRIVVSVRFSESLPVLFMAGPVAWICTTVFLGILYPKILKRIN